VICPALIAPGKIPFTIVIPALPYHRHSSIAAQSSFQHCRTIVIPAM
jgi:hypothetical protein